MTRPVASLNDSRIDTIIVAGGVIPTDGVPAGKLEFPPSLAQWVAEHAPRARRICSVCTGAFVLAAAGVLDGKGRPPIGIGQRFWRTSIHKFRLIRLQSLSTTVRCGPLQGVPQVLTLRLP